MKTFCIVSLGCSKNTTDSERICELMQNAGYTRIYEPDAHPSVLLVNSCAFTSEARAATKTTVERLRAVNDKTNGIAILLGCYVGYDKNVRYSPDGFVDTFDAAVGFSQYIDLPKICDDLLSANEEPASCVSISNGDGYRDFLELPTGQSRKKKHSAFLKISEGCSLKCGFCAIPKIRGVQRSRRIEALVREAQALADNGTVEINIIAQELMGYGRDIYGKPKLKQLLESLLRVPSLKWLRLNYCHPNGFTDELIDLIAAENRILPYFDIPLQHINDRVLKTMRRGYTRRDSENLLNAIVKKVPTAQFVSSFISGYPGETDKEHEELLTFISEGRFRYINAFSYSPEPGTAAYEMDGAVEGKIAGDRASQLRQAQHAVFKAYSERLMDSFINVMVDERTNTFPYMFEYRYTARSQWDAPEDSQVLVKSKSTMLEGQVYPVRITGADDYTLLAEYG